jgi:hypothetical protein
MAERIYEEVAVIIKHKFTVFLMMLKKKLKITNRRYKTLYIKNFRVGSCGSW